MAKAGLTQTAIADTLDVFKEDVSQWLNDKSFPIKVKRSDPIFLNLSFMSYLTTAKV